MEPIAYHYKSEFGGIDIVTRNKSSYPDDLKVTETPLGQKMTVWEGAMPESNGKSNFTAILHRVGQCMSEGITIERSEYPDRVRYEADRMRFLIGELEEEPCILDYDSEKHSGYVRPQIDAPKVGWEEIIELVNGVMGAEVHSNHTLDVGHKMTLINFNSLARIIDKVRDPNFKPKPSV